MHHNKQYYCLYKMLTDNTRYNGLQSVTNILWDHCCHSVIVIF